MYFEAYKPLGHDAIFTCVKVSISSQYRASRQCRKFQSCSAGRVKKNKLFSPTSNVTQLLSKMTVF